MEIGARLKEARIAKGLSLDELQEETKIQKRYLVAIEEGNLDILPGKFYARAFIKEYASAVGLDANELLEEHQEEIPQTEETNLEQYSRMQRTRRASHGEKSSRIFSILPTIIVVLLVIGIFFVAWYFIKEGMSGNSSETEDALNDNEIIINNPNEVAEEPADETEEAEEAEEEPENSEEQTEEQLTLLEAGDSANPESVYEFISSGEEVKLTIESEGNTWLEIYDTNNEQLFFGSFSEDQSPQEFDITGEESIYFGSIGYAPALTIFVNGMELEYALDPNENNVQRIRINIVNETE
ncbi:XRE family transcriptional regulator [Compostibacillus humi]|uniref:XRE family transcriptional regulator n=1 Tax=Compostibacillus humi TaxID=1245525 RepID=A0A8J2XFH6_9BACI|nr:RodZ domain-containing protein [Compostibacillus humi]GFZ83024.1 XRE family transcriptional regulator [Compostibacillus humi]